jgi:hypothetical protein
MWGWLKGLWSAKGSGGCIAVDGNCNGPSTLTPLEPKLSSRSCKGANHDATGVLTLEKQLAQRTIGSCWQLQQLHTGASLVAVYPVLASNCFLKVAMSVLQPHKHM